MRECPQTVYPEKCRWKTDKTTKKQGKKGAKREQKGSIGMLEESSFPETQEIVNGELERQQLEQQQQLLQHQRLPLANVSEQVVLPEQLTAEDDTGQHSTDLALATAATLRELSTQVNNVSLHIPAPPLVVPSHRFND